MARQDTEKAEPDNSPEVEPSPRSATSNRSRGPTPSLRRSSDEAASRGARHRSRSRSRSQPGSRSRSASEESTPEERVERFKAVLEELRDAMPGKIAAASLDLGLELCHRPDLGDAEPTLQYVNDHMEALWGWRHVDTQACVRALGKVLSSKDKHDEAEVLYRRTFEGLRRSCGREHPWTLESQNNLGCFLFSKECWQEAEEVFKASLVSKLHVLGPKHVSTLRARCNIAMVRHRGQDGELAAALAPLLEDMKGSSGLRDSDMDRLRRQLMTLYSRIGKRDDARAIQEHLEITDDLEQNSEDLKYAHIDFLIPDMMAVRRVRDDEGITLQGLLGYARPNNARYMVKFLDWTREKITKWTGMDIRTVLETIGHPELVTFVHVTDKEVLLEQAAAMGYDETVKLLLAKAGDADSKEGLVQAYFGGVGSGNVDVVRLFLDHGVDVNQQDEDGKTGLHWAAEYGHEEVFQAMLDEGADLDAQDSLTDTPLDVALGWDHEQIIRLIMNERHALVATSGGVEKIVVLEDRKYPDPIFYDTETTGIEATVVDFYVDQERRGEEHRVTTFPVEELVSNPATLRAALGDKTDNDGYAPADFTWIHLPANNMDWIENLMQTMTYAMNNGTEYSEFLDDELWRDQLNESMHSSAHGRFMKPFLRKIGHDDKDPKMISFMPYISWEWETQKKAMDAVIERLQNDFEARTGSLKKTPKEFPTLDPQVEITQGTGGMSEADERLLKNYLYVKKPMSPIHIRRTLDQFYYYMSEDTGERDADQVISRHFRRKYPEKPVPIMMVDQLWLWILDEKTIITCFPKRWGKTRVRKDDNSILDTTDILDSVLNRLRKKFRDPLLSVSEVADLIIARCLGLHFDEELWETERHRYLEIFDYSIHYITDCETEYFNRFADSTRHSHKEIIIGTMMRIAQARKNEKEAGKLEVEGKTKQEQKKELGDLREKRKKRKNLEEELDEIFDISQEVELMRQIKDIRDELNILQTLFSQQASFVSSALRWNESDRGCKLENAVHRLLGTVERMEKNAERSYRAIEDLLDLKQKQANVSEARTARVSGSTITVFTIVTVIFLPASFMAAFFALPIRQFPFVDDKYELNYAVKWTVIITAALAVPFVSIAIFVNRVLQTLKWLGRGFRWVANAFQALALFVPVCFTLFWLVLKFTVKHIFTVMKFFGSCAMLLFASLFKLKDYPKAKKEAKENEEVLTKRQFVIGWLLRKAGKDRAAQDEEQGSRRSLGSGSMLSSVHELDDLDSTHAPPSRQQTGENGVSVMKDEQPSAPKPTNGVTQRKARSV